MNQEKKFFFSNINYKKVLQYGILVALLWPILSLNVIDSHDWGGDFAQYIQQAINIAEDEPQNKTNYIFNPENPILGPGAYPVGFPILLAPVYALKGNSILAFLKYISLFDILSHLLIFELLKKYYTFWIALAGVLVLAYNPWFLRFKGNIISDIPFLFFTCLSLLFYLKSRDDRPNYLRYLVLGLFLGFAATIRSIGAVLLGAIILDGFVSLLASHHKSKKDTLHYFLSNLLLAGIFLITYTLVTYVLFPIENEHYGFFLSLYDFSNYSDLLLKSGEYYILRFQEFFSPFNLEWKFAPLMTAAFALSFFFLGFFQRCISKPDVKEYFLILYLAVILLYPNNSQGFRFLLPVLPIMIYHMIYGIKSIKLQRSWNVNVMAIIIGVLVLLQYRDELRRIEEITVVHQGPQVEESKEVFEFIRQNTSEDSRIVFAKPRVLGLYANRKSFSAHPDSNFVSTTRQLRELDYDYVLISEDNENSALSEFVAKNGDSLNSLYQNPRFTLYEKK